MMKMKSVPQYGVLPSSSTSGRGIAINCLRLSYRKQTEEGMSHRMPPFCVELKQKNKTPIEAQTKCLEGRGFIDASRFDKTPARKRIRIKCGCSERVDEGAGFPGAELYPSKTACCGLVCCYSSDTGVCAKHA